MSTRAIHARAPGYYGSRPLCGHSWTQTGDLRVTRIGGRVTCRACLRRLGRPDGKEDLR